MCRRVPGVCSPVPHRVAASSSLHPARRYPCPRPRCAPFRRTDRDQLTGLVNVHVAAVVPGVRSPVPHRVAASSSLHPARRYPCPRPRCAPFRRTDRDQLTGLVNVHVAAVVPGVSASVNTVLGDLERQPGEFVTDPWLAERTTLVAEQRGHLLVAAHLLRYRANPEVGADYRDAAEINWFVHRPAASLRPDADLAADLLMRACLARFARRHARVRYADGSLPAPLVYGLPRNRPHIRALYERAGFRHTGDTEVILLARVADLPTAEPRPGVSRWSARWGSAGPASRPGRRTGPRSHRDRHRPGPPGTPRPRGRSRRGRQPAHRPRAARHRPGALAPRPGRRLAAAVRRRPARRLRIGRRQCPLALLAGAGFRELTRTERGWEHRPERPQMPGR